MKTRRGHNQYRAKYGFDTKTKVRIGFCLLFIAGVVYSGASAKAEAQWFDNVIAPCPSRCEQGGYKPSPTPTPMPTLVNVVSYITKKFEPEGKAVVVKAIECFYSESGLRTEAYNYNKNGTEDRGIAQINSIWKMTPEEAHNFEKNIDKAYEIYKRSNSFNAWYGKGCR